MTQHGIAANWPHPMAAGYALAAAGYCVAVAIGLTSYGTDALAYRRPADVNLYALGFGEDGSAHYSPAFYQLFGTFGSLVPEPVFVAAWTAALFAVLYLLVGRWSVAALLFPPIAVDIFAGNVHLILAAVAVFGFRYPALWSLALLTKVTPGVGLLWFAVRREWRPLGIALGVTAAVAGMSFVLASDLWRDWLGLLMGAADASPATVRILPIPVLYRLPVAAVIVVWGARTDRRWTVPIASLIALPTVFFGSLALLVACVPLLIVGRGEAVGPPAG